MISRSSSLDGSTNPDGRSTTTPRTYLSTLINPSLAMDIDEDLSELIEEGDSQQWSVSDLLPSMGKNEGDTCAMDIDQPEDVVMKAVPADDLAESPFSSDDESSDQTQSVPLVLSAKQQSLMEKYTPLASDTNADDAKRYLHDHKIIVDPIQKWSICLDCRRPVDWSMIYNHRHKEHHSRLSRMARIAGAFTDFPSEDHIIPKLLLLGANRQAPYTLSKIHPVEGLDTISAVKCLFAGCGKIYSSQKSFRAHWKTSDSHTGDEERTTVQVHPLGGMMFTQQYVEVMSSPSNLDVDEAFRQIMACSTEGGLSDPPTVSGSAQKASAMSDIYNGFKWNQILEGTVFEDVRQSALLPVPSVNPCYDRIVQGVYDYYWDIVPQLENLGTTVRRWMRSVREG